MRNLAIGLTAITLLWAVPQGVFAQTQAPPPPPNASAQQLLGADQLDQLVAPIALYPDTLLAEVLMASTYPLEVIEADRWISGNKNLKGDQLKAATDQQDWDDSVKALVATPAVLFDDEHQTRVGLQKLGDAVLAQQPDVMDAIRRLRGQAAKQNCKVSSNSKTVSVRPRPEANRSS